MLTPKKLDFVRQYLVDLNATQAAIRAGYSAKTAKAQGSRLLTDVDVQAALQEAMAARAEKVEITAEMVLAGLLTEAQRVDEDASHGARVTAWTQLGKHLGMFTEKHELNHKHNYSDLTDDELDRELDAALVVRH